MIDPLVLILFFILFLLLAGLAVKSFRGNLKGDSILFIGLSQSGKTYMVCKLGKTDSDPKTVSSTVSNSMEYETNEKKKLKLVDIPGNDRIRKSELEKYKRGVRGIVFVVNSQTISNEIRDVAELMFSILTDYTIHSKQPKILIAANQQDGSLAKAGTAIVQLIEKELHLLRKTQAAQLKDTDENAKTEIYLGTKNSSSFSFSQLPNDIEVQECSAKDSKLDTIHSWLYSCT